LRGLRREGHLGLVRLAVPLVADADLVAGLLGPDGGDQLVGAGDRLAVHRGDHVVLLQAGLVGGAALGRLDDADAVALLGRGDRRVDGRVVGAAALDELLGDRLGLLDRDGEAQADGTGLAAGLPAGAGDGGIDPDDLAVHVDQRPAGVARVDRGVGLDRVDHRRGGRPGLLLLPRGERILLPAAALLAAGDTGVHRPVDGADHARGDRAGQP